MSRSGYNEDSDDNWTWITWRGAVASAMKGKRGQALLREMVSALDTLPEKRLIAHELETSGEVCALGAVGLSRGLDMTRLDPEDRETVAATFGIAPAMAAEIVYMNDEFTRHETPEERWTRMRRWASAWIARSASPSDSDTPPR